MIHGSTKAILFLEEWFSKTPEWRQFCWQGAKNIDGKSHYGSYKPITRGELFSRDFLVSIEGYGDWAKPSIEWLDVYFDPKQQLYIKKETK